MADFDGLADKAWFETLLMFESATKATLDFYLPGKSKTGNAIATMEIELTGENSGTFRLIDKTA
jgi:hypothetical protein